jgi:transketolase N-terminal domain/subunit
MGFQDAFLRTVEDVQREVQWAVEDFTVNKVLVTGHSLGAAIGVMNGMFLTQLFEGRGVNVTTQVFGLPRAGNSIWA